ncbi:MAG: hypothetical protein EHM47_07830, partial [Ignavibacteriales bacterium]
MPEKRVKKKPSPGKFEKPAPKWFYLILILLPVIFFILLEAGLRIFNYGEDYAVFKQVSDYYPDKFFLNPDLPAKYFAGLKKGPGVIPDAFDKQKKKNAFRVFVLGGSSTAGWPYVPNASFPRNIKRRLELLYPENTIEIINCGVSAINTFTIRDIVPAVIEQRPDLILIYAGHNEYYGALGVGSTVSLGKSRTLINAYLWSLQFKTTQLVSNIIYEAISLFSSSSNNEDKEPDETLMSRMIGESLIPLNSDLFETGIEQFKGNMHDVIEMFDEENIPVIIGTLTCNTRDLKPFVSVKSEGLPEADEIFNEAQREYEKGNIKKADELFLYAKELDALRFRAPEKINDIIKSLAAEFNLHLVDVDSEFKALTDDGIVGYNLTVDHLHPNIEGYRIIAESFFRKMEQSNLLPKGERNNITVDKQDSLLKLNFPFTKLDSVIAHMKVIQLTGEYPFVPKGEPNRLIQNFRFKDFIDSTALKVINNEIFWEEGHGNVAKWYYDKGDYKNFLKEMDALIAERPYFDIPYERTINLLIEVKLFNEAIPYLEKLHLLKPSFFTTKWLGQIAVQNKNYRDAKKYLLEAVGYSETDYQVWYNLSGAYFFNNEYKNSLAA